jgi:hypothetical protein
MNTERKEKSILLVGINHALTAILKSLLGSNCHIANCDKEGIYNKVRTCVQDDINFDVIVCDAPIGWYGLAETILSIPQVCQGARMGKERPVLPHVIAFCEPTNHSASEAFCNFLKMNEVKCAIIEKIDDPFRLNALTRRVLMAFKLIDAEGSQLDELNIPAEETNDGVSAKLSPIVKEDEKSHILQKLEPELSGAKKIIYPWQDTPAAIFGYAVKTSGVIDLLTELGLKCDYIASSPAEAGQILTQVKKMNEDGPELATVNFFFNSSENNRFPESVKIAATLQKNGLTVPIVLVASVVGDVNEQEFLELGKIIKKSHPGILINFNGNIPKYVNQERNHRRNLWVLSKTFGYNKNQSVIKQSHQ